jgi:hypothetical protein
MYLICDVEVNEGQPNENSKKVINSELTVVSSHHAVWLKAFIRALGMP